MMKVIRIDSKLAKEAEPILENMGVDIETIVKMTLKRVIRDNDISFITSQQAPVQIPLITSPVSNADDERMNKGLAISLFEKHGFTFSKNTTFASKNRSANNYWANPYFFALEHDWFLILNDWKKRELHLFVVPAGMLHEEDMVARFDQKEKIDLQIAYGDKLFTDNRSRVQFIKYLKKTINY